MSDKLTAKQLKGLNAELDEAVRRKLKETEELVSLRNPDGTCAECGAAESTDPEAENPHEPGCVFKKLEHEVEMARTEWLEVMVKIPPAQAEYDKALDEEAKHKDYDKPLPAKVEQATDRALAFLFAWLDRKVVLENTIRRLLSTAEIERRQNVSNRMKEIRVASNAKKETARDQGVPHTYLGASGNFKPGLDARYKSDLIASALGEKIGPEGLHQFTKDSALERLAQRSWLPHLEKAKKNREAKAAKAKEKVKATPTRSSGKKKAA